MLQLDFLASVGVSNDSKSGGKKMHNHFDFIHVFKKGIKFFYRNRLWFPRGTVSHKDFH